MSYRFEIAAGASKKLLVGGKYCEEDIIVTALGGSDAPDAPDIPDAPATPEYSEGLEIENGTVYGIGTCTDDIIVIPEEHQGLPVTTLYGPYGGSFKQIIMPDSMKYIEGGVSDCPNLERVEFGADLEAINYWSFNNNTKCKEYDFTRCTRVPALNFDDEWDAYSFQGMPSDCKMIVPDDLFDEWSQATNWTLYATHITSPSSANTEKKSVMYKQNGTYEVLPSEGKLLRKVTVFVSISSESQGLEYNYDDWSGSYVVSGYGTWDGEHLVIPAEHTDEWGSNWYVEGIAWEALDGNSKIRSVTLPSSLTWLRGVDFYNCPKLTHVYMPDVSMIDSLCMRGSSFEYVQFRDMWIIGGNVFTGCKYCVFDFTDCSEIPTLDSYGAGEEFGTNPIIRVPASLLDEWRSATNWTLYAAYIVAGA